MRTNAYDYREARRLSMNFGMRTAVWWSISFLCTMYGVRYPILANLGVFIAIFSVYYAGRLIRWYNQQIGYAPAFNTWWLALITYFFATLSTTLVQYIYFRFLDKGMMLQQMEQFMQMPEYRQLLQGFSKADIQQSMELMKSPAQMTYAVFLFNIFLGLLLSFPTMLIGIIHVNKKQ